MQQALDEKENVLEESKAELEEIVQLIQTEQARFDQEILKRDSIIKYYETQCEDGFKNVNWKGITDTQKEIKQVLEHSRQQLTQLIEDDHRSLKTLLSKESGLLDEVVLGKTSGQAKARQELEALKAGLHSSKESLYNSCIQRKLTSLSSRIIPQKGTECPDYKIQKTEIYTFLQQRVKKGDTWYLVDVRWMKQWRKYVGYDQWDQSLAGQESTNPKPVDNSNLFKSSSNDTLKEHLMEELDYYLLPEPAWCKLLTWYGIAVGSKPIARKVVEHGLYWKHCKVEVYLLEFKLMMYSNQTKVIVKQFSRADTVGDLELELKKTFSVSVNTCCRVWHRYMTNTYELLSKTSQTLQDAGLYNGQAVVLEVQNTDGTWPRSIVTASKSSNFEAN